MQNNFQGESINFIETQKVKEGVTCDTYSFNENLEKDLGIVTVAKNTCTPLQKILKGEKTIEGYVKGGGKLIVTQSNGETVEYIFPDDQKEVELYVGDTMRWCTTSSDLVFYEICYPPYEDGRFENLSSE